jgi:paraquat-inducible protein B
MSKKANPALIGIFIFAGLLLGVGGLLLFTSWKLFKPTAKVIVYFDNDLNGLSEGAPVKFRGVTIGSVTRVMIRYNQSTNDMAMPVIFELQEDLIRKRLEGPTIFRGLHKLDEEVRKGMRARLETESMVTGVLYVEIDREESPPPAVYHELEPIYPEIPSRPTDIQKLMKNLTSVDLAGLVKKIDSAVTKADSILGRIKIDEIQEGVTNVLVSANKVLTTPDLTNTFTSARTALDEARKLVAHVDDQVDPLVNGVTNTLGQLDQTLAQARGAMYNLRDTVSADSALRNKLNVALDRITEAGQSISTLADYLHNHPNSIFTGRNPAPENKP